MREAGGQDSRGSLGGGEQGWGLTAPGDCVGPAGCLVGQVQLVFCSCVLVKIRVGLIILTAPHRDKSLWLVSMRTIMALNLKFKEVSHSR